MAGFLPANGPFGSVRFGAVQKELKLLVCGGSSNSINNDNNSSNSNKRMLHCAATPPGCKLLFAV